LMGAYSVFFAVFEFSYKLAWPSLTILEQMKHLG
jgi:hypothetical protein